MKASAYCGLVVVDIAAVERDCATGDVDATSRLPNNKSTSVKASTPSGQWSNFQGMFKRQARTEAVLE